MTGALPFQKKRKKIHKNSIFSKQSGQYLSEENHRYWWLWMHVWSCEIHSTFNKERETGWS